MILTSYSNASLLLFPYCSVIRDANGSYRKNALAKLAYKLITRMIDEIADEYAAIVSLPCIIHVFGSSGGRVR